MSTNGLGLTTLRLGALPAPTGPALGSNLNPDPAGVVGKDPAYMGTFPATAAGPQHFNFVACKPSNWADGDVVWIAGKVFQAKRTAPFGGSGFFDVLVDLSGLNDVPDGPEGVLAAFRTAIEGNTSWRLDADFGGDSEHATHQYVWTGTPTPDDITHIQFPWCIVASHEVHFDIGIENPAADPGVTLQTGVGVLDLEQDRKDVITVSGGIPARFGLSVPPAASLVDNDIFHATLPMGAPYGFVRSIAVEFQKTNGFARSVPASVVVDIRNCTTPDEVASAIARDLVSLYQVRAISWNRASPSITQVVWESLFINEVPYGFTNFTIGSGMLFSFGGRAGVGDLAHALDFRTRSALYTLLNRGVLDGGSGFEQLIALTAPQFSQLVDVLNVQPPAPFTAAGGETSHTFTGLTAFRRYRLKATFQGGAGYSGDQIYLQPDGSDANTRGTRLQVGAAVSANQDGNCVLGIILAGHGEWEISPRRDNYSRIKGELAHTETAMLAYTKVLGGTSTNFTSLKFTLSGVGAFQAGDTLELEDLGLL